MAPRSGVANGELSSLCSQPDERASHQGMAASDAIPGAVMVPVGPNDPQKFIGLIPIRTQRTIGIVSKTGIGDPEMVQIAKASEGQLRALSEACREVADWLHEHTS